MLKPSPFLLRKFIVIVLLLCFSCTSVPYVEKYNYNGTLKELSEHIYYISNGKEILLKKSDYTFTKNGRVKTSATYNSNDLLVVSAEKKLWFTKQSYLDRESYYCKTRWKTKNRERISCYTQKRYKENEAIHYYFKDGRINKIVDNFKSFETQYFNYNNKNELISISIKGNNDMVLDSILIACKSKDQFNNCTELEKKYTIADSLIVIKRDILY